MILGPTHDDLTREAVSELLGLSLDMNETLLRRLRRRFEALGYDSPPGASEAMANVPKGGRLLTNPLGAAPGLDVHSTAWGYLPSGKFRCLGPPSFERL